MAQTKTPDELRRPKAQTKKTQSTPDKLMSRSSAAQHNGKGRGGIEKKETTKPTCKSSPNYMKPTTCSDARKEPLQVSAQSPAPATVVKAKNHADQSNSKPSPSLPVAKYSKTLARKASLRPRRPSMKKIYETSVLSPRRKVSRATCSSTMKESKSPNVSEVNPGNKVAELTSAVVKVCPFNYCSLHGRRHQHLQPLRRLPSARRRSFRTQRSVKLRRVSSIRKRSFKKGGRSMNSGQTKSTQETNYDISKDLSAKSKNDLRFGRRIHEDEFDREISKFLESLESSEDDTEFSEEEIEEFGEEDVVVSGIAEHGLEESKLAIGDGSQASKDRSSVAENGGGGNAADNVVCFEIEKSYNQSAKLSHKQKARRRSVQWKKDIEMEMLRLIDPRAPRFLPVEPDPADHETVDLRHRQTDERKSSETWMIDDALQKAVRKLTPARSKKVALLVEAFEVVMSVPIHDLTLKSQLLQDQCKLADE